MSQRLHRIITQNMMSCRSSLHMRCVFLCRMFVFPSEIIGLVSLNTSSVVVVNINNTSIMPFVGRSPHINCSLLHEVLPVDILVRNRSVGLKVISLPFFQDIPSLNNEFKSCRNCCCFRDCPGIYCRN